MLHFLVSFLQKRKLWSVEIVVYAILYMKLVNISKTCMDQHHCWCSSDASSQDMNIHAIDQIE